MLDPKPVTPARTQLPATGTSWKDLEVALQEAKASDYQWKEGRMALYVYWLDEQLAAVAKEASSLFFMENGLGRKAFPSVQKLESEVIGMALSLFHAPPSAGGSFTSGGTESIFQAVKTARSVKRAAQAAQGVDRARCNIVIPRTAHPAFDKAAYTLDMDVIRVPVLANFRADVAAMADAIDSNTAMIVGSAPGYPYGVFDPIAELSDLAVEKKLLLHVDACVGGFLAPFMKMNGSSIPNFDFALPGVSSLSADIHKYGFSAKGASLILYRDQALKQHQVFAFDDWPRGAYSTETFLGTRAASPVASAWAVMNYLGKEGYQKIASIVEETQQKMIAGVNSISELEVVQPHSELSFVLYRSRCSDVDINAVADCMDEKGWFVGRNVEPVAIHFMVNPVHAPVLERYLADLAECVTLVKTEKLVGVLDTTTY
ncbi:pyridoxal phosphate-dependent decarboxylase family protein [Ottowia thiooxydans]|uniref:pyridoxal phosphate-dependent decarboxylase family protein n=1 Tax=Ottowia thiooxydans TaxID=219182 RepID=UPI0003F6683A|nr:aspartate aminotransferase family protein [Ottowia thiooxydans]